MDDPITSAQATEWARLAAEQLQKALPDLVVSKMAKSLRAGRVFVDWHQNHERKTTVAPYSLRGRERPTVAAPRTWAELEEPGFRHLELDEVLDRLAEGLDPMSEHYPVALATAVGAPDVLPQLRPRPAPIVVRTRPRSLNPRAATELSKALPAGLSGPVAVELARAEEQVPGPRALPGNCLYELKFDWFLNLTEPLTPLESAQRDGRTSNEVRQGFCSWGCAPRIHRFRLGPLDTRKYGIGDAGQRRGAEGAR